VSASVGQFEPGGDPEVLGKAIRDYAADVAADFDLAPADIARTHADARSGYAIEITREGQRHAQRRFEPEFGRADAAALAIIAKLWNAAGGTPRLPESGWSVNYLGLPLSMEERRLVIEQFKVEAELGITSKVALFAKLHGITEDQAREKLRRMRQDRNEFE
jgi:hypothetical protein